MDVNPCKSSLHSENCQLPTGMANFVIVELAVD